MDQLASDLLPKGQLQVDLLPIVPLPIDQCSVDKLPEDQFEVLPVDCKKCRFCSSNTNKLAFVC